ncbi:hypothetical protein D6C76_04863, partial [Aureobasidium pullulans]
ASVILSEIRRSQWTVYYRGRKSYSTPADAQPSTPSKPFVGWTRELPEYTHVLPSKKTNQEGLLRSAWKSAVPGHSKGPGVEGQKVYAPKRRKVEEGVRSKSEADLSSRASQNSPFHIFIQTTDPDQEDLELRWLTLALQLASHLSGKHKQTSTLLLGTIN